MELIPCATWAELGLETSSQTQAYRSLKSAPAPSLKQFVFDKGDEWSANKLNADNDDGEEDEKVKDKNVMITAEP